MNGCRPIVVAERGQGEDLLTFDRAYFLDGQLEIEVFERLSNFHALPLGFSAADTSLRYGFINCLVTPEVSLIREGLCESPGRVMNQRFLPLLYEQYLRIHDEMIHRNSLSGRPRGFAYTAVDMSDPDYEANTELFHEKLTDMIDVLTV